MNSKANLLGVVLCGGESKRMGKDKGLLLLNGRTWVEHTAQKLKDQNVPTVISINDKQQKNYSQIFSSEELILDELPMHGPLNGLLTVHKKFPAKDILLLACDLIDMDATIIQQLINAYEKNAAEYFSYEENNFFQPLCSIYTSSALGLLLEKIKLGSLANYSFQYILNNSNTFRLQNPLPKAFTNYNSTAEFKDKP